MTLKLFFQDPKTNRPSLLPKRCPFSPACPAWFSFQLCGDQVLECVSSKAAPPLSLFLFLLPCLSFFRPPSRLQRCLSSVSRLTPARAVSVCMCVQPWVHVCCCEVEHVCVGPQHVWVNCSSLLAGTQWHGSLSPPLICFPTERRERERAGGERVVPVLLPALHAWCFFTPDLSGIEPLSNTCTLTRTHTHRERTGPSTQLFQANNAFVNTIGQAPTSIITSMLNEKMFLSLPIALYFIFLYFVFTLDSQ